MFNFLFNWIFPKNCCICKKQGNYICPNCKKIFKRNLPECYRCRRISPKYNTHTKCKNQYSLDNVFVAWEYNHICSQLLKDYKYKGVKELSDVISSMLVDAIIKSNFTSSLEDSLILPVPSSFIRINERGFNQVVPILEEISHTFNLDTSYKMVHSKYSYGHQAQRSKSERSLSKNPFYISKKIDICKYKSITLVDDVITTGSTLEKVCKVLRNTYNKDLVVNAICIFRGRPNYK